MSDLKRTSPFKKENNNNLFEPSSDTKFKWLMTRKKRYGKGTVSLPGMFTTEKYASDALFFLAAIIAEFFGLYVIWQASGFSQMFIWLVIGAFIVDLACAVGLHWYEGEKTLYQNKLHYFENNDASEDDWGEDEERPKKRLIWNISKFIFTLALSVLAIGKILLYYYLPPQTIDGITIGICLSYLFVAYVHFFHTGYFLAEVLVNHHFIRGNYSSFNKLRRKKENKYYIHEYRTFKFTTAASLITLNIDGGRHYLEAINPKNNGGNNYQFRTWGILTDDDLLTFIDAQETPDAVSVAAKFGHDHQMEILKRNAQALISRKEEDDPLVQEIKQINVDLKNPGGNSNQHEIR